VHEPSHPWWATWKPGGVTVKLKVEKGVATLAKAWILRFIFDGQSGDGGGLQLVGNNGSGGGCTNDSLEISWNGGEEEGR